MPTTPDAVQVITPGAVWPSHTISFNVDTGAAAANRRLVVFHACVDGPTSNGGTFAGAVAALHAAGSDDGYLPTSILSAMLPDNVSGVQSCSIGTATDAFGDNPVIYALVVRGAGAVNAASIVHSGYPATQTIPLTTTANGLVVGYAGSSGGTTLNFTGSTSTLTSFRSDAGGLYLTAATGLANGVSAGTFTIAHTVNQTYMLGGISIAEAAGGQAYTVAANAGSYSITGQAATVRRARKVVAASSSYAISGQAAAVKIGRKVGASVGSYGISGVAAALKTGRKVTAASASYSLGGVPVSLVASRKVAAAAGAYSITGSAAGLGKTGNTVLLAVGSSYSLAGQPAALRNARRFTASAGGYLLSGTAATLRFARKVAAANGAYAIAGAPANLVANQTPIIDAPVVGGGSDDRRKARHRVKTIHQVVKAARKAKDDELRARARAEAIAVAREQGLATEALIAATSLAETAAAIRALARQLNSTIGQERVQARRAAVAAERAEAARRAQAEADVALLAEKGRRDTAMAEDEDIAIALLLVA